MLLYHITADLNHTGKFELRHSDFEDERDYTNLDKASDGHICFSSSLHGCIGSMSSIATEVEDDAEPVALRVFEIDSDSLPENSIVSPKDLVKSGLVWDAELHQEYWILNPLEISNANSFEITLHSLEYDSVRLDSSPFSPSTSVITKLVLSDEEGIFELCVT